MKEKKSNIPSNAWSDFKAIVHTLLTFGCLIIGVCTLLFVLQWTRPRGCGICNARSRTDDNNIRTINRQIELYKINTGYWPEFPNMESLLTSGTYFPDDIPRDPFTNEHKLGVYSLDMRGEIPHVYSEPHTTNAGTHRYYCSAAECP